MHSRPLMPGSWAAARARGAAVHRRACAYRTCLPRPLLARRSPRWARWPRGHFRRRRPSIERAPSRGCAWAIVVERTRRKQTPRLPVFSLWADPATSKVRPRVAAMRRNQTGSLARRGGPACSPGSSTRPPAQNSIRPWVAGPPSTGGRPGEEQVQPRPRLRPPPRQLSEHAQPLWWLRVGNSTTRLQGRSGFVVPPPGFPCPRWVERAQACDFNFRDIDRDS